MAPVKSSVPMITVSSWRTLAVSQDHVHRRAVTRRVSRQQISPEDHDRANAAPRRQSGARRSSGYGGRVPVSGREATSTTIEVALPSMKGYSWVRLGRALRRGGDRVRVRRECGRPAPGREGVLGRRASRPGAGSPTTSSPDVVAGARFLWAPWLGCFGIQRIDVLAGRSGRRRRPGALRGRRRRWQPGLRQHPLRAAGRFFDDPQWSDITDWRAELAPHYDQAKRMLGVTTYPR